MSAELIFFFNNVRFQIAGIVILAIIAVDYIRNPHLRLNSTKCFTSMLICTTLNLVLDMSTVYAVINLQQSAPDLTKFLHQLFFLSIIVQMTMFYLYIYILSHDQRNINNRDKYIAVGLFIISVMFLVFGKIKYFISDIGLYSFGTMTASIYLFGFVLLMLTYINIYSKESVLTSYQKTSIQAGMLVWISALLVQFFFPTLLISGLGGTLLVLCLYFSFENQRENYDSETGCYNRGAFHRKMTTAYESGKPITIVNVILSNYDRINTSHGHSNGRAAMKCIQNTIDKYLCHEIFHSRSNMFTVFFCDKNELDCDRLVKLKNAFEQTCLTEYKLECKINVMDLSKYTKNADEAYELISFIRDYQKKSEDTICELDENVLASKARRDKLDHLLSDAIKNNGFEMVYQPIYCTEKKCYRSAEALVRLKDTGDLGFVSPEEFIPLAEEKGMIMDIGDITLALVARFAKRERLFDKLDYIEINLSGIQASAPQINERLTQIALRYGISPSFFNLEITETAALDSGTVFDDNVKELRSTGFSFSMDDFGTGYSNLSQMNQMRYDLIKIDKSLIWDAFKPNGETAEKLLSSVIDLLKAINVKIVAEGVETEEMSVYLREKGVHYLQGYYYSKPVSEEKFLEVIA